MIVVDVVDVVDVVLVVAVVAVVAVVDGLDTVVGEVGLDDCARMDCDVSVNDKSSRPLIFRLIVLILPYFIEIDHSCVTWMGW